MKNLIYFFCIFTITLSGCKSYKDDFDIMSQERDSLIYVVDVRDSSINSFLATMNEIEGNLDTIKSRKEFIEQYAANSNEINDNQKERINENIRIINQLLDNNKRQIEELQRKTRSQGGRISQLKNLTDKLQAEMAEKDKELVALKFQLDDLKINVESLNVSIDTLTVQNTSKDAAIKDNIDKLHVAYYAVGTFKELRDKNVVDAEGGFLGIGKAKFLRQDFNDQAFTKIDTRQIASINIDAKDARLLTTHPSSSYIFKVEDKKVASLTISDYEKFWGASKYLVILKN